MQVVTSQGNIQGKPSGMGVPAPSVLLQAVDSWIEKLDVADLRPLLSALFGRYVDPTLEYCRRNFKYVVPVPAISQVMSICKILESILPQVQLQQCLHILLL